MSDFEYWRLCERLTLIQAALLIAGHDPSGIEKEIENWGPENQPDGYAACRQALIGAIGSERLAGYLHYEHSVDINGDPFSTLVPSESYVDASNITEWLSSKGMRSGFFFPEDDSPQDYLDPDNERFAPKLAAAVRAWEAAGSDPSLKGTPKQKVEKWLRLHASEFGLTQKDGNPNESAIGAIAKIANWRPEGGAPSTPSTKKDSEVEPKKGRKVVKLKTVKRSGRGQSCELDDDIPF